jgi:hypothetical protein
LFQSRLKGFISGVVVNSKCLSEVLQDRGNVQRVDPECVMHIYHVRVYWVHEEDRVVSSKKLQHGRIVWLSGGLLQR